MFWQRRVGFICAARLFQPVPMLRGTALRSLSVVALSSLFRVWKPPGETKSNKQNQNDPPKRSECCPAPLVRPKRGTEPWSLFCKLLVGPLRWRRRVPDSLTGDASTKAELVCLPALEGSETSSYVHVNVIKCPAAAAAAVLGKLGHGGKS